MSAPYTSSTYSYVTDAESKTFSASDFYFSDYDYYDTLQSIKITYLPANNGSLTYNGSQVYQDQIIQTYDLGNLSFTPEKGDTWDYFYFEVSDGSEWSSSWGYQYFYITPSDSNSAPYADYSKYINMSSDETKTFSSSDFSFYDYDSGDSLQAIKITSTPGYGGSLKLYGSNVYSGQEISTADIGGLTFTPQSGDTYDYFYYQVSDGKDWSSSYSSYVSFSITQDVNYAPTAYSSYFYLNDASSKTFNSNDFSFYDSNGDSLQAIKITSTPSYGSLSLNGVKVYSNQEIQASDISQLLYTPKKGVSSAYGEYSDYFDFKVYDGKDWSSYSSSQYMYVSTSTNSKPSAGYQYLSMTSLETKTFKASDFGFYDYDSGDSLQSVKITSLPSYGGTLKLYGSTVYSGKEISVTDISGLTFTPQSGDTYDYFYFKVSDGKDWSNYDGYLSFDIKQTASNSLPYASSNYFDITNSKTFKNSDFGFYDADTKDSLQSVKITSLPGYGGKLTLNGSTVHQNQEILASELSKLTFTFEKGDSYDYLYFQVSDGKAWSSSDYYFSFYGYGSSTTNSAPIADNTTLSILSGQSYTFDSGDFSIKDPDGDEISSIKITQLPVFEGILMLDGMEVSKDQEISVDQLGDLVYIANGEFRDIMSFQVSDGTNWSNNAKLMFNILDSMDDGGDTGENTTPVVSDTVLEVKENSKVGTKLDDFESFDEEDDVLSYSIVSGNIDLDGDGKSAFVINKDSGQISINDKDDLNYEYQSVFSLEIGVSDGELSGTGMITVELQNVIEKAMKLNGGNKADTLVGGEGKDTIKGNAGNDYINGALGNDRLTGGNGADKFVFNTKLSSKNNVDIITDFKMKQDKIVLDSTIFSQFDTSTLNKNEFYMASGAVKGKTEDHRIIYNLKDGSLYYDADGSGSNSAVKIAVIGVTDHAKIAVSDFLII